MLLVVLVVVVVLGWRSAYEIKNSVWQGGEQLIIGAGEGEEVAIIKWQPKLGELTRVVLPSNLALPLAQGYGVYRVKSVVELDRLEKKGGELLKLSLQEGLGVGIDGYVVGSLKLSLIGKLREEIHTNLTWWDLVRLAWAWGRAKERELALEDILPVREVSLFDGSQVLEFEEAAADRLAQELFGDEELRKGGQRIAVVNATAHKGLGARTARIISNLGGVVVNVTDASISREESAVVVNRGLEADYLVRKLGKILEIKTLLEEDTSEQRADVVVWLGEDSWRRVFSHD